MKRGSFAGVSKLLFFCAMSRPAVGPTHPFSQWIPGLKRSWIEVYHSTSVQCRSLECVDLGLYSPVRFRGVYMDSFIYIRSPLFFHNS